MEDRLLKVAVADLQRRHQKRGKRKRLWRRPQEEKLPPKPKKELHKGSGGEKGSGECGGQGSAEGGEVGPGDEQGGEGAEGGQQGPPESAEADGTLEHLCDAWFMFSSGDLPESSGVVQIHHVFGGLIVLTVAMIACPLIEFIVLTARDAKHRAQEEISDADHSLTGIRRHLSLAGMVVKNVSKIEIHTRKKISSPHLRANATGPSDVKVHMPNTDADAEGS